MCMLVCMYAGLRVCNIMCVLRPCVPEVIGETKIFAIRFC